MGTNISILNREDGRACRAGYPTMSKRFEWLLTTAVIWLVAGVFLDGWAHNNIPELIETFFTPWHAVLYSGFTVSATVLVVRYLHNVKDGYHWRRGLPKPYLWSLAGVVIFSLAGNLDFLWHEAFGFEEDVEALLSPSHLALAAGAVMIVSSVLRARWQETAVREFSGWRTFLPVFLSFFAVLSLVTFFAQFANVFTHPNLFSGRGPVGETFFWDVTLISAALLPTMLVIGSTLVLLRRWSAPFGTITAIFFGNALLMFVLNWDQTRPYSLILIAPLAAGLLADILLRRWQRSAPTLLRWRLFSFLIPFTLFVTLFGLLITQFGIWWSIHMWLGVSFLAGLVGLGLSMLLLPPVTSTGSLWYTRLMEVSTNDGYND